MDNIVCGRCLVSQITQFGCCIFLINRNIFHLKLNIALVIPASNEAKIQLDKFSTTRGNISVNGKLLNLSVLSWLLA